MRSRASESRHCASSATTTRPQQKRAKEHKKMVAAVAKGDEVVTNGGLLGKVIAVGDSFLTVNIAEGVDVKLQRGSLSATVPKGTIKSS